MWASLLLLPLVLGECYASSYKNVTYNKRHLDISKHYHLTRAVPNGTSPADPPGIVARQLPQCKTKICTSIKRGYRPFVVMRDGKMMLEDGTPFRFASFNAPDLLANNDNFEAEDTMRTIGGFGRGVARTYTLIVKGTSPHLGTGAHITGWDKEKNDWIYNEAMFKKVCQRTIYMCEDLTGTRVLCKTDFVIYVRVKMDNVLALAYKRECRNCQTHVLLTSLNARCLIQTMSA